MNCSFRSIGSWAARQVNEVRKQAPAARMIGEFVIRQGVRQVEKRMQGSATTSSTSDATKPSAVRAGTQHDVEPEDVSEKTHSGDSVTTAEPFADYDTYTSRQVLDRIASMDIDGRRRVWEYENSHRRRETILSALTVFMTPSSPA